MNKKIINYGKKQQAILDILSDTRLHPSADWIYSALKPSYPNISMGTVYRNLAKFKAEGTVRSLEVVDGQEHYDGNIAEHTHFICDYCGAIYNLDIAVPYEIYANLEQEGFWVSRRQLFLRGRCPACTVK